MEMSCSGSSEVLVGSSSVSSPIRVSPIRDLTTSASPCIDVFNDRSSNGIKHDFCEADFIELGRGSFGQVFKVQCRNCSMVRTSATQSALFLAVD